MPSSTEIIVEGTHVHPATGHITIRVKTVTKDGNQIQTGPVRGYGVDAVAFRSRFNSDLNQFLDWVRSEHRGNEGAHGELVDKLTKLAGQKIG